jgi:hypothetical protein
MSEVVRDALLFEAGSYPDKGVVITENDLDVMISAFRLRGEVPVRVQHAGSPWDGRLGRLVDVRRDGKRLYGKISWPRAVWDFLCAMGTKCLSLGLSRAGEIAEVSVVDFPRVLTARAFGSSIADGVSFTNSVRFVTERGVGVMAEYSPEVQAAIDAARDMGRTEGAAEARTQFDAQLTPLAQENAALKRKSARDAASVKLAGWVAEGKLPPACVKFAEGILVDGAAEVTFADGGHMPVMEAFVQFMTNLPRVVPMVGEKVETDEFTAEERAVFAKLGVSEDDVRASEKGEVA